MSTEWADTWTKASTPRQFNLHVFLAVVDGPGHMKIWAHSDTQENIFSFLWKLFVNIHICPEGAMLL